jgi:hypothetical protein
MTDETGQQTQIVLSPEELQALVAAQVAAHIASLQPPAPEPVPPPPPVIAPLDGVAWPWLVYYVKHAGAVDLAVVDWLRVQLGDQFDAYVEAYGPGGVHHHGGTTWDRVP